MKHFFYFSWLLLISINTSSCKERKNNSERKVLPPVTKELLDTIPQLLIDKYKATSYFSYIADYDTALRKDIDRVYSNNDYEQYRASISYTEKELTPNLTLIRFLLPEEVEYDYLLRDKQIIFRKITPIQHSILTINYKDWDGDAAPDLILSYKECEAGCLAYRINNTVYAILEDSSRLKVSMPVVSVICYEPTAQHVNYDYTLKNNLLSIKKIYSTHKCGAGDKGSIDSTVYSKITIKQFDNYVLE